MVIKMTGIQYLINALIFILFIASACPTITVGDSSEIVAAAFSSGLPHPPGYPLLTNFAKLVTFILPFGNLAFRVNILSAVFGMLSCFMVYLITLRIQYILNIKDQSLKSKTGDHESRLHSLLSPVFAGASLALSLEFWYRSTVAEAYTLNTFLILLILYIVICWKEPGVNGGTSSSEQGRTGDEAGSPKSLYLASFLLGLGIGNHQTIVLIVPGVLIYVIWNRTNSGHSDRNQEAFFRRISLLSFFFLLGISIYLYLPLRSAKNPVMDWGNPQNMRNFIDVFTRKTYLPDEMGRDWGMFVKQIKTFNPVYQFTPIGFIFGLIGLWGLWKRDKAITAMLASIFILTSYGLILLAGSATGEAEIMRKFYLPSHALFSVFMGVGAMMAMKYGHDRSQYILYLTVLPAIASLALQFIIHYPKTWNSNNYVAYDYGMNELNSIGEGSVYISKGEVKTFPLWYLQGVERYREDVKVITAYFLSQRWYGEEALRLVAPSLHGGAGYSYKQMMVDAIYRGNEKKGVYTGFIDSEYIADELNTYSQGIAFLLYRDKRPELNLDVWNMYQMRGVKKIDKGMEEGMAEIVRDYASGRYNTGLEYYENGEKDSTINEFKTALSLNPDDPDALNNLAILYVDEGTELGEAKIMAEKAFEIYTGEKDKSMVLETLKEIQRKEGDMEAL